MSSRVPVVAVLNSNDDVVELLRMVLEQHSMVVVSAHVDAIKRGGISLADFFDEHDPDVVIYDLVPPYDRSWRFLEHLRHTTARDRPFVITSTNAKRAKELAEASGKEVFEIVGKPYDVDVIIDQVRRAAGLTTTSGQ